MLAGPVDLWTSHVIVGLSAPCHNEHIVALGMNGRDGDGRKMAKDADGELSDFLGTVMWCGQVTIGAGWPLRPGLLLRPPRQAAFGCV